ncbi:MAG: hypothetical protein IPO83_04565 [Chitinophagaceae bacterium]|nr:hypothetical protein [Chitinophagaceae bacterium]
MNTPVPTSTQSQLLQLLTTYFDFPKMEMDENAFIKIREALVDKLDFLLNHDYEKLLWLLYRIDVDEEKAKATLASKPDQPPAEVLTDMIIERLIEKAKSRASHPTTPNDDLID